MLCDIHMCCHRGAENRRVGKYRPRSELPMQVSTRAEASRYLYTFQTTSIGKSVILRCERFVSNLLIIYAIISDI